MFVLLGCTNNQESNNNKPIIKNKTVDKNVVNIKKKKSLKPITKTSPSNKNIKEFLLKYGKENKETIAVISTNFGNIKLKLYKDTPLHRANFIRLVKTRFYDNTLFYRIVENFVIQGGDSDDDDRKVKKRVAGYYTIPAEIMKNHFHKKGAIAMTRDYKKNPKKRSAAFDFYIVKGEKYNFFQLDAFENEYKIKIDDKKRKIYETIGGAPHLDGEHTVFGEVVSGMDVVDKIASVKTDRSDWPIDDVVIKTIKVIK